MRKILQSQKTFANYLDDFLALQQSEGGAAGTTSSTAQSSSSNKRAATTKNNSSKPDPDTIMTDAAAAAATPAPPTHTLLDTPDNPPPAPHPADDNPLFASRVPDLPTDAELRALLSRPPLTFLEARATYEEGKGPPPRVFCEVCGYWGKVRCMKCGTRVCALDCLELHREECVTRYGL